MSVLNHIDETLERYKYLKLIDEAKHVLKHAKLMGWVELTKQLQDFIDEHKRIAEENGY